VKAENSLRGGESPPSNSHRRIGGSMMCQTLFPALQKCGAHSAAKKFAFLNHGSDASVFGGRDNELGFGDIYLLYPWKKIKARYLLTGTQESVKIRSASRRLVEHKAMVLCMDCLACPLHWLSQTLCPCQDKSY